MAQIPEFFVPNVKLGTEEEMYAMLAASQGLDIPDADRRIYSIKFRRDEEEWTATVGETMSGSSVQTFGRGKQEREIVRSLTDGATVRAIFAGDPVFKVITDGHQTRWSNPFIVGNQDLGRVIYFPPLKKGVSTA